jgi:hypothetical protein
MAGTSNQRELGMDGSLAFWRKQLAGSEMASFPAVSSPSYQPRLNSTVEYHIKELSWPRMDDVVPSVVRAAWSLLLALYTDSNDVVFGSSTLGSQVLPAFVPVRVVVDWEKTVDQFLQQVHDQATDLIPFQHMELDRIRKCSEDAERACLFQTLIVVHPTNRGGHNFLRVKGRPTR